MAAYPDPDRSSADTPFADEVPHAGHRLIAAILVTLPQMAILTATLWAVAAACTTPQGLIVASALIFAGLLPFSLSVQQWRGSWLEDRMKLGRLGLVALSFTLIVLFGPGPVFLGASCTTGPTVLQSGIMVAVLGAITWTGLRCIDSGAAR
ncbi:MAG: hypothetical protein AAGM84_14320 [Pseudomonadota bacterium]